jgi:hypothetical protein
MKSYTGCAMLLALPTPPAIKAFRVRGCLTIFASKPARRSRGVVGSFDTGQHPLTEAMIDLARTAVAKWLAALDAHARWGIQK